MPLFKTSGKLIYYAHVPKCGGSAVAAYLSARFGAVAFENKDYFRISAEQRWSQTSPQHIDTEALDLLFPPDFFDVVFTIVRHPVARLVSAYHFQKEIEKTIPESTGFSEWLEDVPLLLSETPRSHDNHIRPMCDLVPARAEVFHLESGLDALVPWMDTLVGDSAGPRSVPQVNKRGRGKGRKKDDAIPSESDRDLIASVYAKDFERFGYDPRSDGRSGTAQTGASGASQTSANSAETPARSVKGMVRKLLG